MKKRAVYYINFDAQNNKTEIFDGANIQIIDGANFEYLIKNNSICFVSSVKTVECMYRSKKDDEAYSKRFFKKKNCDDIEWKNEKTGITYRSISALLGSQTPEAVKELYRNQYITQSFEQYIKSFGDAQNVRFTLAHQVVKIFYKDIAKDLWQETYHKHRHIINDFTEYNDMRASNKEGLLSDNVISKYFINQGMWDLSSAYPSVMVSDNKFPIGNIVRTGGNKQLILQNLNKALKSKQWCKIIIPHKIESLETFYDDEYNVTAMEFYDILFANKIGCFNSIIKNIDDDCRLYTSKETGYLADVFRNKIVELYNLKSSLKKGTFERFLVKTELDMLYGKSIEYRPNIKNSYDVCKYYRGRGDRYLTPEMGNHCAAKVRYLILCASLETDANYFDTDGLKCDYTKSNIEYFNNQNEKIAENNAKAGFPDCKIGLWDFEGKASRLLILCSKCYIFEQNNEITYKIAGVTKQSLNVVLSLINSDKIEHIRKHGLICIYNFIDIDILNKTKQIKLRTNYGLLKGDIYARLCKKNA